MVALASRSNLTELEMCVCFAGGLPVTWQTYLAKTISFSLFFKQKLQNRFLSKKIEWQLYDNSKNEIQFLNLADH